MKNVLKYLLWLPFAVTLGAFILYLRYFIKFKLDSNIVITDQITNTLNMYLIVAFVSLFIGLLIILFKKIMNLIHGDKTISKKIIVKSHTDQDFINAIEGNSRVITDDNESNFMREFKSSDVINIKLNKKDNDIFSGEILGTNKNVNILFSSDDLNKTIQNPKECPKCKGILDMDAIICTHCGILLDKSILNNTNKEEYNKVKPKGKFSVIKLIVNILIIIICIFLIFLIGNKIINQRNQNISNINYGISEK